MKQMGRKWLVLLISVCPVAVLMATALLFLLVINKFTVEVQLKGVPSVTLEYGESYVEAGASAALRGSMAFTDGIGLDPVIRGAVPELTLGTYTITYTASFGPWQGSAERTVVVEDTQAPVITLFTNYAVRTRPGMDYREEGYVAVDNHDGDIPDRVEVTAGEGVMIYTVTDSSGNTAAVTRPIRYASE